MSDGFAPVEVPKAHSLHCHCTSIYGEVAALHKCHSVNTCTAYAIVTRIRHDLSPEQGMLLSPAEGMHDLHEVRRQNMFKGRMRQAHIACMTRMNRCVTFTMNEEKMALH